MFSPSSPAATASNFRSTSAANTVTAPGAATVPAAVDCRSFEDALSAAAAVHDDSDDTPKSAAPAANASVASHSPVHAEEASADGAATRPKDGEQRSAQTGETPESADDEHPVVTPVLDPTVIAAQKIVPALYLANTTSVAAGEPEGNANGLTQRLHVTALALQERAGVIKSTEATDGQLDESRVESGGVETPHDRFTPIREPMPPQEIPTAESGARLNPKEVQVPAQPTVPTQGSTSPSFSNRALSTPGGSGDAGPKPGVTPATREAGTTFVIPPSLTAARMMTIGDLGHGASALAASALPTEADALPQGVAQQIIDAIRLQWSGDRGAAQIQLEPSHFGELTVSLHIDQGQVTARLEAGSPAVREWLQNNQAFLRNGLAEHNLTLDRLEVAEPPESRDADRRDSQQPPSREGRPRRPHRPDTGELFEVVA